MQILVILAHPDSKSFNHAIAQAAVAQLKQNGHRVFFHDLHAEGFDPILPIVEFPQGAILPEEIDRHCQEISSTDGIIIVHPNWWGQPPAILKGWIDRVIRPDVAYKFLEGDKGDGVPVGLLKAKAALVLNTSNTPIERELAVFGDPLETLWKNCIFGLCGVTNFYRENFGVIVTSTDQQRRQWLEKVQTIINRYFPKQM
ncbi:MAG TPA: NAD(P)H-dependent oxidoreductase [Thermoguttaceae bacterium]